MKMGQALHHMPLYKTQIPMEKDLNIKPDIMDQTDEELIDIADNS